MFVYVCEFQEHDGIYVIGRNKKCVRMFVDVNIHMWACVWDSANMFETVFEHQKHCCGVCLELRTPMFVCCL